MNLTLAIPARDDAAGLERLLTRAAGLGCVSHLVVVDDGSAEPLWLDACASRAAAAKASRALLRGTGTVPRVGVGRIAAAGFCDAADFCASRAAWVSTG